VLNGRGVLPVLVVRMWWRDAFQVHDPVASGLVEQPPLGSSFYFLILVLVFLGEARLKARMVLDWCLFCVATAPKQLKTRRPLHGAGQQQ
jgi:hypothetical protein